MLAFFAKNKKSNRSTDRRRGDSIDIDNNSNENRNKPCRDHDGTMAHGYNN